MKIYIDNKYLYIYNDENEPIAYFEEFEDKKVKRNVIALASEGKDSDKFIKKHNGIVQTADVIWFSGRKLKRNVIFIKAKNIDYHYLILLK